MKCIKTNCWRDSLNGSLTCAECRVESYIKTSTYQQLNLDMKNGKIYPELFFKGYEYLRTKDK